MNYDKGNIIEKRGIIFKDDFTPDPKGKQPAMITIAVTEDNKYMYFLTLTSQTDKYFDRPEWKDKYFILKKTEFNMLKKTSLVNLQNIYKEPVANDYPVAFVQPDEFKKLIRKFIAWQELTEEPDEFYDEIKPLL